MSATLFRPNRKRGVPVEVGFPGRYSGPQFSNGFAGKVLFNLAFSRIFLIFFGSVVSTREFNFTSNWSIDSIMQFLIGLSELVTGKSHGRCSNTVRRLYILLLIVLFKQRVVLPVAHLLHPSCDVGITCPETVKCVCENHIHAHSNVS